MCQNPDCVNYESPEDILETAEQLNGLGWCLLDYRQNVETGRWCIIAKRCGHHIIALADTHEEARAAARSMAFRLTQGGLSYTPSP
jgi:hypothetical protein